MQVPSGAPGTEGYQAQLYTTGMPIQSLNPNGDIRISFKLVPEIFIPQLNLCCNTAGYSYLTRDHTDFSTSPSDAPRNFVPINDGKNFKETETKAITLHPKTFQALNILAVAQFKLMQGTLDSNKIPVFMENKSKIVAYLNTKVFPLLEANRGNIPPATPPAATPTPAIQNPPTIPLQILYKTSSPSNNDEACSKSDDDEPSEPSYKYEYLWGPAYALMRAPAGINLYLAASEDQRKNFDDLRANIQLSPSDDKLLQDAFIDLLSSCSEEVQNLNIKAREERAANPNDPAKKQAVLEAYKVAYEAAPIEEQKNVDAVYAELFGTIDSFRLRENLIGSIRNLYESAPIEAQKAFLESFQKFIKENRQ